MKLKIDGNEVSVSIVPNEEGYVISVGNKKIKTFHKDPIIRVNKKEYLITVRKRSDGLYNISVDQDSYLVELVDTSAHFKQFIKSPMQGTILSIDVKKNQKVEEDQTLVRILSMKMENEIKAERSCTIKDIKVKNKQTVAKGDLLFELRQEKE